MDEPGPPCSNPIMCRLKGKRQRNAFRIRIGLSLVLTPLTVMLRGAEPPALPEASAFESLPGRAIYQEHCASCHGDQGQGTPDGYEEALFGDRSIKSLAGLITRTMPEEEPEDVTGEQARQVAEYIYHAFYSEAARARIQPAARIELSRLTVSQYRNAVADLVAGFPLSESNPHTRSGKHFSSLPKGLQTKIYESKGMSKANELKVERVDATINYDFGEGSPGEDIAADQFAITWDGSLWAPDTGTYEFRIRTENGARLYLNAENTGQRKRLRDDSSLAGQAALIDGWVSSGELRDHTARIFLLGGRLYPIRIEFFKYKEDSGSIRFDWKPPHRTWELLDQRATTTASAPRTFVVEAPFPADDRSAGYERGTSVSATWQNAITQGAAATATEVITRLAYLAQTDEKASDHTVKLQAFLTQFATGAFRRPLTSAETALYSQGLFSTAPDPESAVRRGILLALTSPHFLYSNLEPEGSRPTPHHVANRLAMALWDSVPDSALRQAAENGDLDTDQEVRQAAERLLEDPRTRAKIQQFFEQWLALEERDLAKDRNEFPEFDEAVMNDLHYSLRQFINRVVWSPESDFRELLLSDQVYLNDRLQALYAPEAAGTESSSDFQAVALGPKRAGILTHPLVLSAFAYHDSTSPIHRGVFLTRNVMGRQLKPPPEAVAFKNDEFPESLTMREKITELTKDAACMTCHSIINPLGFSLEAFDAIGRARPDGEDIDTQSDYTTLEGDTFRIETPRGLAEYAAHSPASHQAFVTHLFRFLIKQDPSAFGPETRSTLQLHFQSTDYNIKQLIVEIAVLVASKGQAEMASVAEHNL